MAEFGCIWVSTCGLGGRGRVGHSGALVAEGTGVFAVIWGWLVGRCGVCTWLHSGCCISCCLPSGAGSLSMGLGAGFHLLGHFRGPIPLVSVVYPGCWVNLKVAFARGGVDMVWSEVCMVRSMQPTWHDVERVPWLCPGGCSPGPVVRHEVMVMGC